MEKPPLYSPLGVLPSEKFGLQPKGLFLKHAALCGAHHISGVCAASYQKTKLTIHRSLVKETKTDADCLGYIYIYSL